jgi:hypothetical protein
MNVHYGDGGVDGKSISERIAPLPKGERSPTKKKHQCMAKKRELGIASQSFEIQRVMR